MHDISRWLFGIMFIFTATEYIVHASADGHEQEKAMILTSAAFTANGELPVFCTCDGQGVSPPLQWQEVPAGAESLVLIMDDPDAPGQVWVHWVLYNLPPTVSNLPKAVQLRDLPKGVREGLNSWDRQGYGRPGPPSGSHRYYFKLYALDTRLPDRQALTKGQVEDLMKKHVIGSAELMGTYRRK